MTLITYKVIPNGMLVAADLAAEIVTSSPKPRMPATVSVAPVRISVASKAAEHLETPAAALPRAIDEGAIVLVGELHMGRLAQQDHRFTGAIFEAVGQQGDAGVQTTKIVYWQEDQWWLGYLEEFPDYWTQGQTLADLEEHLRDLHSDLTSGDLPGVRHVADLTLA